MTIELMDGNSRLLDLATYTLKNDLAVNDRRSIATKMMRNNYTVNLLVLIQFDCGPVSTNLSSMHR